MKFHNAVAPSPSTSHKSHSSVEGAEPVRATPTALRPQRRSGGGVARETIQSKEDDLRMQEQREEEELKQRRKVRKGNNHYLREILAQGWGITDHRNLCPKTHFLPTLSRMIVKCTTWPCV